MQAQLLYDLNPVDRITVGAIGVPGRRAFFLQARQGRVLVTVVIEKEQVLALAAGIDHLLMQLAFRFPQGEIEEILDAEAVQEMDMELEHPIDPLFRVSQMGLGYDQETDQLVLLIYELPMEEEPEVIGVVRFWASRAQMEALSQQAKEVIAAGRPICPLCGQPMDPAGHFCIRSNGDGKISEITKD